jgi:hypothetical protein
MELKDCVTRQDYLNERTGELLSLLSPCGWQRVGEERVTTKAKQRGFLSFF